MKVKVGKYPNRLTCNIHTRFMDYKYGFLKWPEEMLWSHEDYVFQAIEDGIQSVYNIFNWIWFDRRTQKVKVRIDKWDTWSMDCTLAPIILPMLKQLKATTHGYPADLTEQEWDYVLDEMIWAFEQKCRDDWMSDFNYNKWDREGADAHQKRMSQGFALFGKYYENLWD